MKSRKMLLLAVVALVALTASATAVFSARAANSSSNGSKAATAVTASDVYTNGSDPWGTAFDSNGMVWVALPGCDPTPQCGSSTPPGKIGEFNPSAKGWLRTYTLPAGYAQPLFLAFDAKGKLWFPMPMNNSLGELDPSTGTFQQWTVPTASSGPWAVAVDKNGLVWFTEHYGYKVGSFNPSNQTFTEFATPSQSSQPYGITVDSANNVWFTENNSSVALIGELTPQIDAQGNVQASLKEYKIRSSGSTSGLTPHQITIDSNDNVWWSEGWVSMIGELKVSAAQPGTTNGVTEYGYRGSCSNCGSHTSGITADHSGNIWFDDSLQSIYGSFPASGSGSFSLYNTPTSNSHPHDGLNVDGQNRLWFDEEFANKLAYTTQIAGSTPTPSPTVTNSPTATATATNTPTTTPTATTTPVSGAALATDNFQRANQQYWGKASDGTNTWSGDAASSSLFTISSNTGQVASGNGSNYNALIGASASNVEVLVSGSLSSFSNSNFGALARWQNTNNMYKAYIDGGSFVLLKWFNGKATTLKSVSFAAKAGTSYTIRFNVNGTTLSAKVWATGTAEPSSWTATATDSSLQSGYCGIRVLNQNGAKLTITAFSAKTV